MLEINLTFSYDRHSLWGLRIRLSQKTKDRTRQRFDRVWPHDDVRGYQKWFVTSFWNERTLLDNCIENLQDARFRLFESQFQQTLLTARSSDLRAGFLLYFAGPIIPYYSQTDISDLEKRDAVYKQLHWTMIADEVGSVNTFLGHVMTRHGLSNRNFYCLVLDRGSITR